MDGLYINQKGRERCDRKKLKTQCVLLAKRIRETIRISGDFCGEKRAFSRSTDNWFLFRIVFPSRRLQTEEKIVICVRHRTSLNLKNNKNSIKLYQSSQLNVITLIVLFVDVTNPLLRSSAIGHPWRSEKFKRSKVKRRFKTTCLVVNSNHAPTAIQRYNYY